MGKPSARAQRVWDRLTDWYGVRFTDTYGSEPSSDWCRAIDATDNNAIKRALSIVRSKYLEHPPTLPQFLAALKPAQSDIPRSGPSVQEQLADYVVRILQPRVEAGDIPAWQFSQPWTYLHRESTTEDGKRAAECVGVLVPPVKGSPGMQFTVADMQASRAAA